MIEIEQKLDRKEKICSAIKKLNTAETRYVFVDYITTEERDFIKKNSGINLKRTEVIENLNKQLHSDISECFNVNNNVFEQSYGRGLMSSHNGNCNDIDIPNPTSVEIINNARIHQDDGEAHGISGFVAAMAILGPGTVFVKYNDNLYNEDGGFNKNFVLEVEQSTENQVAIWTMGNFGAAHGWPYCKYDKRLISFFLTTDDTVVNSILGADKNLDLSLS